MLGTQADKSRNVTDCPEQIIEEEVVKSTIGAETGTKAKLVEAKNEARGPEQAASALVF